MKHKTLSIIIPAYNEARTLFTLLEKVHHTRLVENIQKEIIVINDCSKDETEAEIQRFMETYPDCPLQYHKTLQPRQRSGSAGRDSKGQRGVDRYTGCRPRIRTGRL